MSIRKFTFFVLLLSVMFLCTAVNSAEPHRKKLIELGWDIPTTQFLREHWKEMEATTPFDGVIYQVAPKGRQSSQGLWTPNVWNRDDYAVCIDDLKACTFQQYTDNFIRINYSPAGMRWDDDAAWKAIADKVALCAWISKESGGKGLAPDFESYGAHLFRYQSESGLSFEETSRLAFQRGAEFVRAVASEQPDAVILCLWMNSINTAAGHTADPQKMLRSGHYGLLPAYINGMLSAAPKEMVFVDGCEHGYYYNGAEEYQRAALNMLLWTGPAMNLVPPELKQTYRSQVQAGFGFYLDMYSNKEGSRYYRGPNPGETRMDRLCINLKAALNSADEYVWVYGEKHRWWNVPPATDQKGKETPILHWNEALPGLTDRLWEIKDPVIAARRISDQFDKNDKKVNLLENGDFTLGKENKLPDKWGCWQLETVPQGKFSWDKSVGKGAVLAKEVRNGCLIQSIKAAPGERYFFRCHVKSIGQSSASIRIRWQTEKGTWTKETSDVFFFPDASAPKKDGFQSITGLVTVPEGVGKLVVLLSVTNQEKPEDLLWYDNAEIYKN